MGALLGPFGGPLGADMELRKGSEKYSGATLGPLRPTLGPTWAKLAQPGPIWALRGPQTGPKWAPSRPNLGQIWGHVGPFWANFGTILGPILGTKIGFFLAIFGVIFWITFWVPFGPLLGLILGTILGPDRPKKGAR